MVENFFAAVELGGTKCIAGIGDGITIVDEVTIPTRLPGETVKTLINFINKSKRSFGGIRGLGIASFGPIDLNFQSADFGCIQNSPKKKIPKDRKCQDDDNYLKTDANITMRSWTV